MTHSKALMKHSFDWAREVNACQPLTVAAWRTPKPNTETCAFDDPVDQSALALSDIISFHAYCDLA